MLLLLWLLLLYGIALTNQMLYIDLEIQEHHGYVPIDWFLLWLFAWFDGCDCFVLCFLLLLLLFLFCQQQDKNKTKLLFTGIFVDGEFSTAGILLLFSTCSHVITLLFSVIRFSFYLLALFLLYFQQKGFNLKTS